jgi:trimeric autotransporter adhesin
VAWRVARSAASARPVARSASALAASRARSASARALSASSRCTSAVRACSRAWSRSRPARSARCSAAAAAAAASSARRSAAAARASAALAAASASSRSPCACQGCSRAPRASSIACAAWVSAVSARARASPAARSGRSADHLGGHGGRAVARLGPRAPPPRHRPTAGPALRRQRDRIPVGDPAPRPPPPRSRSPSPPEPDRSEPAAAWSDPGRAAASETLGFPTRAAVRAPLAETIELDELRAWRPAERLTLASTRRSDSAACCARDAWTSSDSAASGRAKRCARTAPLPRSRSLPRRSWSSSGAGASLRTATATARGTEAGATYPPLATGEDRPDFGGWSCCRRSG